MSDNLTSNEIVCERIRSIADRFRTKGDMAVEMDRLQQEVARYENGRVILTQQIERQKELIERRTKQLSERLQQIEQLKQKLTAAEQLAVRQGNEIRKLRAGEKA